MPSHSLQHINVYGAQDVLYIEGISLVAVFPLPFRMPLESTTIFHILRSKRRPALIWQVGLKMIYILNKTLA